jgi:outer membrane protein assembly factor BamB
VPKSKLIFAIAAPVFLVGVLVFILLPHRNPREVKGVYPSPDSYFRQNICGTGVCDFPGPKAYLHVRFVIDKMGPVEQTPSVSDGSVFASGECQRGKLPILISFDEYSGSVLWQCETDSAFTTGIANSPFTTSKAVFIGNNMGNIYCVDRATGKIAWGKKPSSTQLRSTAIVHGGRVYIGGADFYCMDEKTGELLWSYAVPEWGVEGSPAYCDGLIFFGEGRGIVHALNAETGKEVWTLGTINILTGSSLGGAIYSSPAVADNVVCIGVGEKLFAIDAGTGREKWSFGPAAYNIGCSPAIWQNKVYIFAEEKKDHWKCYCLDLATGGTQWTYDIDGKMSFVASAVISDGIVYFGDMKGTFYALDAKTGDVVFKEKVADSIDSSVAIHDHAAFFANMNELWCVEDYRFNPRVIKAASEYADMLKSREEKKDEIARLIMEMGSVEYEKREAAKQALSAYRLAALPQLKEGVKNPDLEIATRCDDLLKIMQPDIEALDFVEQEKWYEKPEYFLLILESARDQFVEPSIHALERLTGEKFIGDLSDIKTARVQAYKQYTAWLERNKPSPQENK